jgi:hypothetical protein
MQWHRDQRFWQRHVMPRDVLRQQLTEKVAVAEPMFKFELFDQIVDRIFIAKRAQRVINIGWLFLAAAT